MKIILGPPGCGKTTRLLGIVDEYLAKGVMPERIAFVSFTKKAASEAAERASKKFSISASALPYFRTIHSLAFQVMGINKSMVMGKQHFNELEDLLGVRFTGGRVDIEEGLPVGSEQGDRMLFIDNFARTRMVPVVGAYRLIRDDGVSLMALERFSKTLEQYKRDNGIIDFTDMLSMYVKDGPPIDVDIAIIDEAQDLSTLQWRVIEHAFGHVKQKYIAGDDDQAIYKWAGADVDMFLGLKGEQEVLNQSYRLPATVYDFANKISNRIQHRFRKEWQPRNEAGKVQMIADLNVDFKGPESWLILARNNFMLKNIHAKLRLAGVPFINGNYPSIKRTNVNAIVAWERLRKGESMPFADVHNVYKQLRLGSGVKRGFKTCKNMPVDEDYTLKELQHKWGLITEAPWHEALEEIPITDRAYYLSVLRNGYRITQPPKIRLSTVHGVKGGEADNVILFNDMAYRTHDEYSKSPDDEHRVFYVGATRARHTLYLSTLGERYVYDLPIF